MKRPVDVRRDIIKTREYLTTKPPVIAATAALVQVRQYFNGVCLPKYAADDVSGLIDKKTVLD